MGSFPPDKASPALLRFPRRSALGLADGRRQRQRCNLTTLSSASLVALRPLRPFMFMRETWQKHKYPMFKYVKVNMQGLSRRNCGSSGLRGPSTEVNGVLYPPARSQKQYCVPTSTEDGVFEISLAQLDYQPARKSLAWAVSITSMWNTVRPAAGDPISATESRLSRATCWSYHRRSPWWYGVETRPMASPFHGSPDQHLQGNKETFDI